MLINQNIQNPNPPVLNKEEKRRDETKKPDTSNIKETTYSSENET